MNKIYFSPNSPSLRLISLSKRLCLNKDFQTYKWKTLKILRIEDVTLKEIYLIYQFHNNKNNNNINNNNILNNNKILNFLQFQIYKAH